jgi:hypothetical protein
VWPSDPDQKGTWVRLYDAVRTPAHWLDIIRPGQYCVFILDARDRIPKDLEGRSFGEGEASVQIAATFDDAARFAEEVVSRHPELCAEIYNHEGKSGEPIRTIYEPSVRGKYEGMPLAKRSIGIGLLLLAGASAFVVCDARHDLRWMWGYIVGLKLAIVGGSYLVRGIAGYFEHRLEPAYTVRHNAD